MQKKDIGNLGRDKRNQAANEAGFLLNEAIRELLIPTHLIELSQKWQALNPLPISEIAAVRHLVFMSIVVNIFRLRETRQSFIEGWLLSDDRLRELGFPPLEDFIGAEKWSQFEVVRHQYAGHATGKEGTWKSPGRIVPASVLGKAIRETGLSDLESLLARVRMELVPGVERVRDEIYKVYPAAKEFIITHALDIEKAMLFKDGEGDEMKALTYPRSPKVLLGGIAHLGRFIDKVKLRNAGKIQDYNYITVGFDKYLIDFLQIDAKAFEQQVLAGESDENLLNWVKTHGRKHSEEEIAQWSTGLLAGGPKDDAAKQRFQGRVQDIATKRGVPLASLPPVTTWADVIELDEERM